MPKCWICLISNKYIKSKSLTTITDQNNNKIYLNNFEYLTNKFIFKSIGEIKVEDNLQNTYNFSQIYIDTKSKELLGTDIKSYLNRKKLTIVKKAQKQALIKSFKKKKISFREFRVKTASEEVLGELFSYFILETIIVGKLLNINPFDQPAVEQVKVHTKEILS